MSNTGGRGSSLKKKESGKLVDKFKEACPPHKLKDLDSLVRQLKGDEDKIQQTIAEWWEEPETVEPEWEDVNKKSSKKTTRHNMNGRDAKGDRGGGRNGSGRGGRGGYGRSMAGGRGGGAERRSNRDFSDKRSSRDQQNGTAAKKEPQMPGPAPVKIAAPLQGAWGQRPMAPAPVAAAAPVTPEQEIVEDKLTPVGVVTDQDPTPAGVVDSPLTGDEITESAPVAPKTVTSTGNVWATKGSAHLIEKEKPKPPPIIKQPPSVVQDPVVKNNSRGPRSTKQKQLQSPEPEQTDVDETVLLEPAMDPESGGEQDFIEAPIETLASTDGLEDGLPPSVNGSNVNAAGWKPMADSTSTQSAQKIDIIPSPVGPVSVESAPAAPEISLGLTEPVVEDIIPKVQEVVSAPVTVEPPAPAKVLNMGHWETGEVDESQSLDFGFGSFGADNEIASVEETTINNSISTKNDTAAPTQTAPAAAVTVANVQHATVDAATQAATVSPARPPPGLGIGMPPMPANVVHVHELENKLERASLADKKEEITEKVQDANLSKKKPIANNLTTAPSSTPSNHVDSNPPFQHAGSGVVPNQSYPAAYGMAAYNYNQSASGFMGVHGPVLGANVLPQQPKQQQPQNINTQQQPAPVQNAGPQTLPQQGGIYGAPSTSTTSENVNATGNDASTPGIPPGIPGGMPYNPQLFYSQQPYQMGQHPGSVGYGYGYGAQYGGVQGGFGYQQVMGQGGYGQHYDDQPQHHGNISSHHSGNNHQGGYNKNNGGGYRGRGSHHNNHHGQYQNQYIPQGHGGYGAQPYTTGYDMNHFNQQRGGYGPSNMDPYGMQSSGYQSGVGGFSNQDDDHQHGKGKGKGGNNRNFSGSNPNVQQYQQAPQQQAGQSQDQQQPFGLSDVSHAPSATSGGWSNPGWGQHSWQGS